MMEKTVDRDMQKSVTFRLDDEKVAFLDQLATTMDRDRSYLINEAVENYIDLHHWQIGEIRKAIAEADAGDFASEEEVRAAFAAFTESRVAKETILRLAS
jgi:predicted transcriptional regulator